jgi:hypothetical protein
VGAIGPGEARPFSLSFVDPPLQAASVQVEFAFDIMAAASKAKRPLTRAVAAPSATLKLRGLAPTPATPPAPAKDATPLPANSPYALPSAATPSQHA